MVDLLIKKEYPLDSKTNKINSIIRGYRGNIKKAAEKAAFLLNKTFKLLRKK